MTSGAPGVAYDTWKLGNRTLLRVTGLWSGLWGSFWYGQSDKNYSRALESAGINQKRDQSFDPKLWSLFFTGYSTFQRSWIVFSDSPYQKLPPKPLHSTVTRCDVTDRNYVPHASPMIDQSATPDQGIIYSKCINRPFLDPDRHLSLETVRTYLFGCWFRIIANGSIINSGISFIFVNFWFCFPQLWSFWKCFSRILNLFTGFHGHFRLRTALHMLVCGPFPVREA